MLRDILEKIVTIGLAFLVLVLLSLVLGVITWAAFSLNVFAGIFIIIVDIIVMSGITLVYIDTE